MQSKCASSTVANEVSRKHSLNGPAGSSGHRHSLRSTHRASFVNLRWPVHGRKIIWEPIRRLSISIGGWWIVLNLGRSVSTTLRQVESKQKSLTLTILAATVLLCWGLRLSIHGHLARWRVRCNISSSIRHCLEIVERFVDSGRDCGCSCSAAHEIDLFGS